MPVGISEGVPSRRPLRICIGNGTKGRPIRWNAVLNHLKNQRLAPTRLVLCCTTLENVHAVLKRNGVTIIRADASSSQQQSCILNFLSKDSDLVMSFKDDFDPTRSRLELVGQAFRTEATIASVTGSVLADSIVELGLSESETIECMTKHDFAPVDWPIGDFSPDGCNIAFRCSAIGGLRFDERFVIYEGLEDLDFGAEIAKRGMRCVEFGGAFGVLLGIKIVRVDGLKLALARIMILVYMYQKEPLCLQRLIRQVCRSVTSNFWNSVRLEPYGHKRGQLLGNVIAMGDILRFLVSPERA